MMCLRTNWAGTGCSDASSCVVAFTQETGVCVGYQGPYLPASTVLHALQAQAGGHGWYSERELAASFPAAGSRDSAAHSPRVWTKCCLCEFGFLS